jgi:glycosyltransferase involved in cell wall biosynthesis
MNASPPTAEAQVRAARVLHVVMYYRPDFSGEAVFLERSSARMRQLAPGVAHDLLAIRTPRPAVPPPPQGGIDRVVYLRPRAEGVARSYLRFLWWIATNLHRYRTVHFRTHLDWYCLTYAMARLSGRRTVHSATLDDTIGRMLGRYRPALRPYAARMLRIFHAYIAISPKLLAETVGYVPEGRAHLLPCGIEAPEQPPETRARIRALIGAAPGDPVLVSVGGLCARKDQATLIAALPALTARHPGIRLVLVGPVVEADYAAALHSQAQQLGVDGRVHFAGHQDNPHPWYAAADSMVFASREEGFGTVVPEAMAHGLPVVARRLPGVNDWFLRDGETGLLFETDAGYAPAIERLLDDAALRARLGEAARHEARTRFDMDTIARRYLELYGVG